MLLKVNSHKDNETTLNTDTYITYHNSLIPFAPVLSVGGKVRPPTPPTHQPTNTPT